MKFGSRGWTCSCRRRFELLVGRASRSVGGETVLARRRRGTTVLKTLRRRREDRPQRFRRGVYVLPSMFTVGNLFCGYACRRLLDARRFRHRGRADRHRDGRSTRSTASSPGSPARTSAFGVELDSLADVVSFGLAPAILAFSWGLWPLGRLGWAAGFIYVTAAAMRLARFNIQTATRTDKRYFAGMPSPAAAAVIASTVYLYPWGLQDPRAAALALAMVLVPAFLMVSTIRFRSVKAIDVGWRRSPSIAVPRRRRARLIASHPRAGAGRAVLFVHRRGAGDARLCSTASTTAVHDATGSDNADRRDRVLSRSSPRSSRRSTRCCAARSAGPSPVPVVLVEKYGSKTRSSASASIPTPVSATRIVT